MHSIQSLIINSKNRTSGNPNEFKIQIPPIEGLKKYSLLYANIPNTLYNIDSTNNLIYFNRGGALVATLAFGAYNITDLIAEISTEMSAADAIQTYTATYDSLSFGLTITGTANFSLTLSNSLNATWYICGFVAANATGINTASALSHAADNCIRLDFPSELFLTINEFGEANVASDAGTRGTFLIPLTVNSSFDEIFTLYTRFNTDRTYSYSNTLTTLTIKLTKSNGELIDLNGSDWSFCLALQY